MYVGGKLAQADRTFDDWHAEGFRRFGIFPLRWFRCPRCGLAHTPGHAAAVGVPDALQGCVCPEAIGGCGFPWFGARNAGEYFRQFGAVQVDMAGMVSISKDGRRVAMNVLPYCPDELVPADGEAAQPRRGD